MRADISHETQTRRIVEKYSSSCERSFWNDLSQRGLFDFEQRAIDSLAVKRGRVAVVGCGCGREMLPLLRRGHDVCGIDLVPSLLLAARQHLHENGFTAKLACADAVHGLPFQGTFDIVTFFEQLYQHIPQRTKRVHALKILTSHLNQNGALLLSSFNEGDVDLYARLRYLYETNFRLPKSLLFNNHNAIDDRYAPNDSISEPDFARLSFQRRLRLARWVVAYLAHLTYRKALTKLRKMLSRNYDLAQCKLLSQINPRGKTEGSFWLRVIALREIKSELEQAGFAIREIFVPLDPENRLSARARAGSPLLLICASRTGWS